MSTIRSFSQLNIYGKPLELCGLFPLTGYKRSGQCAIDTTPSDDHNDVICAIMTDDFLNFLRMNGTDLITRRAGHWGLKEGDRWCLSNRLWMKAYLADHKIAPYIIPEASHISLLNYINIEELKPYLI